MPPSWRWRSRRGWPSLERRAKHPCPRLRRPARVLRKRPSRPAVPRSWPPCARVWIAAPPRRRPWLRTGAGASGGRRAEAPSASPRPSAPSAPELPPVNNAVLWHVDKTALPLSEPRRYRDRAHLEFVASQPCLLCGRQPSDPHHLRFMQPRAMGRRVSDEFAVPLCRTHHRAVHRHGDEAAWWKSAAIDPAVIAQRLWQHTRLDGAPIQEHLDPLLGPPTVLAANDAGPEQSAGPARP
jgi:hypothetical protein